ncbi:MAG: hypothetical protein HYX27_03955 [Acidobacteria bacterium]|nr:hypothetical protein [Acidobacteriota bacterium]
MATAAQVLANQANAQLSTGPKSEEGKQKASRNNLQHGLTLGVHAIAESEKSEFCEFEANFRAEVKPEGIFENEAFQQFIDAAWRLRKIEKIIADLINEYNEDPFVHPDTEASLKPLTRYRAAAEMIAYRAIKTLCDLQTTRLAQMWHLTPEEREVFPPLVHPPLKAMIDDCLYAHNDREIFYYIYESEPFDGRLNLPICEVEPNRDRPLAA